MIAASWIGVAPPAIFNDAMPNGAAAIAPATAIRPNRAFARNRPSSLEAYAMVRPFFAMPWIFESTRIDKASGKRRSVSSCPASRTARTARPAAAANVIDRRGPARSRIGTINGPASANGSMVRSRYSATLKRDSSTGSEKKIDSASEIVSRVSPATLVRWFSA